MILFLFNKLLFLFLFELVNLENNFSFNKGWDIKVDLIVETFLFFLEESLILLFEFVFNEFELYIAFEIEEKEFIWFIFVLFSVKLSILFVLLLFICSELLLFEFDWLLFFIFFFGWMWIIYNWIKRIIIIFFIHFFRFNFTIWFNFFICCYIS